MVESLAAAGVSIATEKLIESGTTAIGQLFGNSKSDLESRKRPLVLVIANETSHTITYKGDWFDSGQVRKVHDSEIKPGKVSGIAYSDKEGTIL